MDSMRQLKWIPVIFLTVAAVLVGFLNLRDRLSWRYPFDGVQWEQTEAGVQAADLSDPSGPGARAGIQTGDRLLGINGIPTRTLDEYVEVLDALAGAIPAGTPVTYQVLSRGEQHPRPLAVEMDLRSRLGSEDIFLMVLAICHLLIGLFIFSRNWRTTGALHFYLICLVSFVLYLYRYSGRADLFDIGIYWTVAVTFLLLPPLFVHFCIKFPPSIWSDSRLQLLTPLLYVPALFLGVIQAVWFAGKLRPVGLARNPHVAGFLDNLHLTHFIGFLMLGAAVLIYARRHAPTAVERQQMKWITYGTVAGLAPFTLMYALPFILGFSIHTFMSASILSLVLIPLGFSYAITRYRLMDVEVIFKKSASYLLSSSALLGLYVAVVLILSQSLRRFVPEPSFPVFAFGALLIALLFAPLKNKIQERVDRYFYRERFDYRRSLGEFGRSLSSQIRLSELTDLICDRIQRTLNVFPVAVYLKDEPAQPHYFASRARGLEPGQSLPSLTLPSSFWETPLAPGARAGMPAEARYEIPEPLRRVGIDSVRPLAVHGKTIGFLALGRKAGSTPLNSEDWELLETLAGYASIAVDNALLYRSLQRKARQLEQLKEYSENVVESISLGVVVVNPEGEVTVWNHRMEELTGTLRMNAAGMKIESLLPGNLSRALRSVRDNQRWVVREPGRVYKTHLVDGEKRTHLVNITMSPFVSRNDLNTGTLLVFDDITEKVQLESQLMQAEKLSSIGLFAAGVAHEVNTPLAGISSYSQMLLEKTDPDDSQRELLEKIEKQSFRASEIINNLLNFARFNETEFSEINLNTLMTETLSLLDHQMRKARIEIDLDLDPSLPRTVGSGGKLQQVFMNLFLNARDAMSEGGRLSVRTFHDRSQLVVEVSDSGVGISESDIKRIYDPFFTTKEVGKGTGLGLSVSYGIIQEHSGQISVASQPGKGTTFTLCLPVKRVH